MSEMVKPKLHEVLGDVLLTMALVVAWFVFILGCVALFGMRFMPPPASGWHGLALILGFSFILVAVAFTGMSAIGNWADRRIERQGVSR